jgi:glycosyltransferase involved in cell wall biosynthesis
VKVLYVQDRPSGGAGESLYQLVRGWKKRGELVILFGDDGFLRERFESLNLNPAPIYYRSHLWLARRWENSMISSLIWRVAVSPSHLPLLLRILLIAYTEKVNIIHTNCTYLIEGAIAAKILRLPHVWQVRELVDLDYYQYILPKQMVIKIVDSLSSVIVCNSRRTVAGLLDLKANPDKLRVVSNIIDPAIPQEDLKTKLGLSQDIQLVGTLGWITPNKRVEDFISLASQITDLDNKVRFVIIGGWGGIDDYNERIKKAIQISPNRENIILTGIIKNAARFLSSLSVLVCPCFTESFGRTVGEALAAGTPAIGIAGTAVEEIVDHGETGFLVKEGDISAMATYTRLLLADPQKSRAFGKLGKTRVQRRFSSEVIIPKLEAVYREVVSMARRIQNCMK